MSTSIIHGNYHGYYTKRPFLNDQRLLVLPPGLFKDERVLDVGCNEGWVTTEIAQFYGAKFVVGVDIDDTLIQAAWKRRRVVWSLQKPTLPETYDNNTSQVNDDNNGQIQLTTRPVVVPPLRDCDYYFPASCEHEFGFLPIPPLVNRGADVFPHNLSFRTADWVRTVIPEDAEGYGVVVGFSITKWIHLNDGDEGLALFFRRVFEVLRPGGGKFVLEPQPWDSYGKAKRGNEKLKENAEGIRLRPEEFGKVLEGIGFRWAGGFVVGDGNDMQGFQRPIDMYIKP